MLRVELVKYVHVMIDIGTPPLFLRLCALQNSSLILFCVLLNKRSRFDHKGPKLQWREGHISLGKRGQERVISMPSGKNIQIHTHTHAYACMQILILTFMCSEMRMGNTKVKKKCQLVSLFFSSSSSSLASHLETSMEAQRHVSQETDQKYKCLCQKFLTPRAT